eukprot:Polyplicarium_translucidae@DN4523_c0_g1_i1.p1
MQSTVSSRVLATKNTDTGRFTATIPNAPAVQAAPAAAPANNGPVLLPVTSNQPIVVSQPAAPVQGEKRHGKKKRKHRSKALSSPAASPIAALLAKLPCCAVEVAPNKTLMLSADGPEGLAVTTADGNRSPSKVAARGTKASPNAATTSAAPTGAAVINTAAPALAGKKPEPLAPAVAAAAADLRAEVNHIWQHGTIVNRTSPMDAGHRVSPLVEA